MTCNSALSPQTEFVSLFLYLVVLVVSLTYRIVVFVTGILNTTALSPQTEFYSLQIVYSAKLCSDWDHTTQSIAIASYS